MPDKTTRTTIEIPEIKLERSQTFLPGTIFLPEGGLTPPLSYDDWYAVEDLTARNGSFGIFDPRADHKDNAGSPPEGPPTHSSGAPSGKDPDIRGFSPDTVLRFDSMMIHHDALGVHVDTFKGDDDDMLALAIASTGIAPVLGQVLARYDLVRDVFDKLIPHNNIRNRLTASTDLLTHAQIIERVTLMLRDAGASIPVDPTSRHYLTLSVAELFMRVGRAYVGIVRRRDISLTRVVTALFPSAADFSLYMQANWIKRSLITLDAEISRGDSRAEKSFEVMINCIAEHLLVFGNELIRIIQQNDALKIAAGIVKWYLTSPIVTDFPPEMRANTNLLTLTSDATFVKYALQAAPSRVIEASSAWTWALETVVRTIKDPKYFRQLRLSEFESFCGMSTIPGVRDQIKAILFWMNIPGSQPGYSYLEAEIDPSTRIGETPALTDVIMRQGGMLAQLYRRTAQDWVGDIQRIMEYAFLDRPTQIAENGGTPTPTDRPPLFVRFGAPAEAVWYYTLARYRAVYPRYSTSKGMLKAKGVVADRMEMDFIVPLENVNIALNVPILDGKIRTSDERLALLGVQDQIATSIAPFIPDGLPEANRDDILFLDSVPTFKKFNKEQIIWDIVLAHGKTVRVVAADWLVFTGMPPFQNVKWTDPMRTRLLANIWDLTMEKLKTHRKMTPQITHYLAMIHAAILKNVMVRNSTAMDIHNGLLLSMINNVGDLQARAELDSDLNRTTNLVRLEVQLGAEIMVQSGVLSNTTVKRWISELDDDGWFAREGVSMVTAKQDGIRR